MGAAVTTIKKLSETSQALLPSTELTATEMLELYIDNEAGHRLLVYGNRPIRGAAPAHDHGQYGGRTLRTHPLLAVNFASKSTGGLSRPGIPIASIAGDLDTGEPVRLCVVPVFLPGGVETVSLGMSLVLPTSTFVETECTFAARIGPLGTGIYRYADHPGISIAITAVNSANAIHRAFADNISLVDLGDCTLDREYELAIYQLTNTGSENNLLSGVVVFESLGQASALARRVTQQDQAYRPVQPADIIGQVVSPTLTALIRNQENQRAVALLGRSPGLTPAGTPDKRSPFLTHIYYPHQHQGMLCPDGFGGFVSDGRVIRRQYAQTPCTDLGQAGYAVDIDGDPGRGLLIHPSGLLDAEHAIFTQSIPISCGTPALDIRFALSPATTDVRTRLIAYVSIYRGAMVDLLLTRTAAEIIADKSLYPLLSLSSGRRSRTGVETVVLSRGGGDGPSYLSAEVDPIESPGWYADRELRESDGRWTRAALRSATEVPSGVVRTYAHRVSQTVTAHLSQPALRSDDTAHPTADYFVVFRLSLETLDSGNYDAGARLLWWTAIPRDME